MALPDVNQKVRTNKLALCKKEFFDGQMPNAKKADTSNTFVLLVNGRRP